MKLEGVGGVSMGHMGFEVGRQIENLDGFKGTPGAPISFGNSKAVWLQG